MTRYKHVLCTINRGVPPAYAVYYKQREGALQVSRKLRQCSIHSISLLDLTWRFTFSPLRFFFFFFFFFFLTLDGAHIRINNNNNKNASTITTACGGGVVKSRECHLPGFPPNVEEEDCVPSVSAGVARVCGWSKLLKNAGSFSAIDVSTHFNWSSIVED